MWNVYDWLYHLCVWGRGWLWMLQPVTIHIQSQNKHTILQLTWVFNCCGSFYKIYCSNIECPIIREVYPFTESTFFHKNKIIYSYLLSVIVIYVVLNELGFPRFLEILEKPGIDSGSLNPGNSLEFCVKTLIPLRFVKDTNYRSTQIYIFSL